MWKLPLLLPGLGDRDSALTHSQEKESHLGQVNAIVHPETVNKTSSMEKPQVTRHNANSESQVPIDTICPSAYKSVYLTFSRLSRIRCTPMFPRKPSSVTLPYPSGADQTIPGLSIPSMPRYLRTHKQPRGEHPEENTKTRQIQKHKQPPVRVSNLCAPENIPPLQYPKKRFKDSPTHTPHATLIYSLWTSQFAPIPPSFRNIMTQMPSSLSGPMMASCTRNRSGTSNGASALRGPIPRAPASNADDSSCDDDDSDDDTPDPGRESYIHASRPAPPPGVGGSREIPGGVRC